MPPEGVASIVDELSRHIHRQQTLLWLLIDAQLEMGECLSKASSHQDQDVFAIHDTFASLQQQYEAYTWQIVPIQAHFLLKLNDFRECEVVANTKQEPDETISYESDEADAMEVETMDVKDESPDERSPFVPPSHGPPKWLNQCVTCGQFFNNLREMKKHLKFAHQPTKKLASKRPRVCYECGEEFAFQTELSRHIQCHTGDAFACTTCDYKTNSECFYEIHRSKHNPSAPIRCSRCDKYLNTKHTLYEHIRRLHLNRKKIKCGHCESRFTYNSCYRIHLRTHTGERPFACTECNESFQTAQLRKLHYDKVHSDVHPFECDICQMKFKRKMHIISHMVIHMSVHPFSCDQCNKSFSTPASLQTHVKRVHLMERDYQCTICEKRFFSDTELQLHMNVHVQRTYPCGKCKLIFSSDEKCRMHRVKMHGNPRELFECDICQKQFLNKHKVKVHMIVHSDVKDNVCDICEKRFKTKTQVQVHQLRMHSENPPEFICDVCGKTLATVRGLERHKQAHSGKKPFICNVCQRPLADQDTLIIHMRTHTGEKPFECDVCGKRFIDKRDVNKHKKRAHDKMK